MAGSVNKVILVGNLGKDPEVRNTQKGTKVVSFTLATSDSWNDKTSGERQERTEWHRIVVFNERIGDVAERYLRKGRKVFVEGVLRTRKWSDQAGHDKYTTEVVIEQFRGDLQLIDSNRGHDDERDETATRSPRRSECFEPSRDGAGTGWNEPSDPDDDVPF